MPKVQDHFELFCQLTKVDEEKRLVYGRATQEVPDHVREIMDYQKSKPYFEQWSKAAEKRSGGKSRGNIREMHEPIAAGKVIDIAFCDAEKAVDIVTYCSNDSTWAKILDGTLTGFSVGGKYAERFADPKNPSFIRYVADPTEISYVDAPAVPTATYKLIKADGLVEERHWDEALKKFTPVLPVIAGPDHQPFEVEPFNVATETSVAAEQVIDSMVDGDPLLEENIASSGNEIKEVPTAAGIVSPGVADASLNEGIEPARVISGDEPAGMVKGDNPLANQLLEAAKVIKASIEGLAALQKAEADEKAKIETELKSRGSSVGIARRDGEPLTAPKGFPEDWHKYGDPANWSWPVDEPGRAQSALAYYNGGKGKENYSTREWHTLGRRIARLASDVFGKPYLYKPTEQKVEAKEEKMSKLDTMTKADIAGLLNQVHGALSAAADMVGKDPNAAQSLLMAALGNLDDATSTDPVNAGAASPTPPMNEQQDAAVSTIKAVTTPSTPSTPSSTPSTLEAAAMPPSMTTPSTPSTKTADVAGAPSSSPSSEDPYQAMKAQVDQLTETVAKLSAVLNKEATPAPAPQPEPTPEPEAVPAAAPVVQKAEVPALDLASLVTGAANAPENEVLKAVRANDLEKAEELAKGQGGLTKVVNEGVQEALLKIPFFNAGHRIYNGEVPAAQ